MSRKLALVNFPEKHGGKSLYESDTSLGLVESILERKHTRLRSESEMTSSWYDGIEERVGALGPVFPDFDITFMSHDLEGGFGPEAVQWVLDYYNVEVGQLSIGVPGPHFGFNLGDLFGVRILNIDPDTSVVNSDPTRTLVALSRQNSEEFEHDRWIPSSPRDDDVPSSKLSTLGMDQTKPDTKPIL